MNFKKISKLKLTLAFISLVITFFVWQQGLRDSLNRPSISFDISQKEQEIAELSVQSIPVNLKKFFIINDPVDQINKSLSDVSFEELTERNKLIRIITSESNDPLIYKNISKDFEDKNYKSLIDEIEKKSNNNLYKVNSEKFDLFKGDRFLYHLLSRKFDFDDSALITKSISNLFFAGQVNGTSGYEEAAAQGLLAGINSVLRIKESEPFIITRNEGYIGVLIDDLITSSINEPYRMFTSSAEYRLSLRSDNADFRLTEKGFKAGIVSKTQHDAFLKRKTSVKSIESAIINKTISEKNKSFSAQKYLCRPGVGIDDLFNFIPSIKDKPPAALFTAETNIKYEGYVSRETIRANTMLQNEKVKIPKDTNFYQINGLSSEAKEKLNKVIPENLGQASRIDGVRPSDIMCLSIAIKQKRFT